MWRNNLSQKRVALIALFSLILFDNIHFSHAIELRQKLTKMALWFLFVLFMHLSHTVGIKQISFSEPLNTVSKTINQSHLHLQSQITGAAEESWPPSQTFSWARSGQPSCPWWLCSDPDALRWSIISDSISPCCLCFPFTYTTLSCFLYFLRHWHTYTHDTLLTFL